MSRVLENVDMAGQLEKSASVRHPVCWMFRPVTASLADRNFRSLSIPLLLLLLLLLLLMTFIGRKLRHAANAPSQPLHDYSYPRTGTFSVVS